MSAAAVPAARPPAFTLNGEALAATGLVLVLFVMVVPLPGFLLDLLLATNIAISLAVLLTAFYAERPLDFGIFPGLLLVTTLFRLSLNVASTRLILGEAKAGALIEAFGEFVVSGNYVVGAIVFLVLVLINFVVITKGSGRIAEVGARFTLDALPGKQMAIDADLNAGLIDEGEAKRRRSEVSREADFYGAMDGASKFVRGDAMAGLVITAINIVGGLIIGVAQYGMGPAEAAQTFTLLSIGDGLVSQIPALLISTAAGLIVSRASGEGNLSSETQSQLFGKPEALFVTAGFMALLGVLPGLPIVPFWALAGGLAFVAFRRAGTIADEAEEAARPAETAPAPEPEPADLLLVDELELEIGYGLIPVVDPAQGGDLLERISMLRRQLATEMGIVVPPVRIRDNVALDANAYVVKLRGNDVARGEALPGYHLALLLDGNDEAPPGIRTVDPTFGLEAVWVADRSLPEAERLGLATVEAPAVIATHLLETLRKHAHALLTRQGTRELLDKVQESAPALVGELVPDQLSVGSVQRVLKRLLQERVPIRDLVLILEALADRAASTKSPEVLTEFARAALAPTLTRHFSGPDGRLHAVVLDPTLEHHLLERAQTGELNPSTLGLDPDRAARLQAEAEARLKPLIAAGHPPVLLTSPVLRATLFAFLDPVLPDVAVLSYQDLVPEAPVDVEGQVSLP
ncbi:flagellar biosynthesis protein FlhA [Rubrivirga marina]|uniref:Flagellar biosynthesis protein FlhA n=1 Tax=Rubrivirga marina TaxID=1196024 RepID=A0A271IXA8_9BACT|nr:flagellar biosynthesis protein FlhA [Rubrivirga marina]PAP75750.1 flagellar biosynthesis protein FlhA [Rubrivirga marina]